MADLDWFIKEGEKDVTAADLMIEALLKSLISSFDELVEHSGRLEALAAIRPYRKWGIPPLVDDLRKRGIIIGNGPDAIIITHAFGALSVGVLSDKIEAEIKEKGAVGIHKDCPYAGVGSPDLCMSLSHFSTEAETELINPEYECIWTHHESGGDPYCRYVFKKKSDPLTVVDDLGKTLMVLPKFELPPKQLQAFRLWTLSAYYWQHTCAFCDLHGEKETMEVIGGMAQRIGQELGARLAKEKPELKESLESVGKLVRAMQNALGQRDNFIIVSSDEVANEITDCSPSMLENTRCNIRVEPFFKGLVSAINPDFEFAYDRMITKGDKDCHWTLKRR